MHGRQSRGRSAGCSTGPFSTARFLHVRVTGSGLLGDLVRAANPQRAGDAGRRGRRGRRVAGPYRRVRGRRRRRLGARKISTRAPGNSGAKVLVETGLSSTWSRAHVNPVASCRAAIGVALGSEGCQFGYGPPIDLEEINANLFLPMACSQRYRNGTSLAPMGTRSKFPAIGAPPACLPVPAWLPRFGP